MEQVELIKEILVICIAVFGLILTVYIYCSQKKSEQLKRLAEQIIAYAYLEQKALDEIESLRKMANQKSMGRRTIQSNLREAAKNGCGIRPTMSANEAKKYL